MVGADHIGGSMVLLFNVRTLWFSLSKIKAFERFWGVTLYEILLTRIGLGVSGDYFMNLDKSWYVESKLLCDKCGNKIRDIATV